MGRKKFRYPVGWELTQSNLKELMEYNPETGIFIRLLSTGARSQEGDVAGYQHKASGYRIIGVNGKPYKAHRLAFLFMRGHFPRQFLDHIDGIRDNNSWANLREASSTENNRNMKLRSTNSSGTSGVYFNKYARKWHATISHESKSVHLGYFANLEDAVSTRELAENEYKYDKNHGRKG